MKRNLFLLTCLACISAGCASVPSTVIQLPTPKGMATLKSPKDTDWSGIEVTIGPDGTAHIVVKSVKASNNADVIASVANANAVMADKITAVAGKAIEVGAAAAAKGATGGLAP